MLGGWVEGREKRRKEGRGGDGEGRGGKNSEYREPLR